VGDSSPRCGTPDPLLDPPGEQPGWFVNVEAAAVATHFKDRIVGSVPVSADQTATVHANSAGLDWTASPRFEVGYRVAHGYGEFFASYRFLATEGHSGLASDQGPLQLRSRLDVNVLDLGYANRIEWGRHWEMRWKIGARVADIFFDAQQDLAPPNAQGNGVPIEQRTGNSFAGAGPAGGLELFRRLDVPGLALYAEVDGASLWGQVHQSFEGVFSASGGPGPPATSADRHGQGVAVVGGQLGLSYSPPGHESSRFFLGYQIMEWFQVGRDINTGSSGDLTEQGIFFRAEFSF
jgi:hypothetical protein